MIVDEAHNARTDLSFTMLKRFSPACIIEFTATPDTKEHPSNILHTVSAAELKAEGMIKLPIHLETHQDWRVAISQAVAKRNELEALARSERNATGEYLRPIILLQAQPTFKNKASLTVEAVKECLLKDNQIPENQVAIATGDTHEIEDVDLFAPECHRPLHHHCPGLAGRLGLLVCLCSLHRGRIARPDRRGTNPRAGLAPAAMPKPSKITPSTGPMPLPLPCILSRPPITWPMRSSRMASSVRKCAT